MKEQLICTSCNTIGKPIKITKGSILIEIVLWLSFLVPGLIYSIWRVSSRYKACPECNQATMIPVSTPRGEQLLRSINQ